MYPPSVVIAFGQQLIEPSYWREPWFSGWDTSARSYVWPCAACGAETAIGLNVVVGKGLSWKSTLGADLASAATSHFRLNLVGKSHDGGWPSISLVQCGSCGARYLLYAGVAETSNSVYRVTIQGLSLLR